jgi:hypothetical protein
MVWIEWTSLLASAVVTAVSFGGFAPVLWRPGIELL